MIPNNVIQRVFFVSYGSVNGTCFTVDVDGKQYIVSAKHIFSSVESRATVKIYHERQWKNIDANLVGHCRDDIDITILAADIQISPTHLLEATSAEMYYGQDVYFLGFPYGMYSDLGEINNDFPLPFAKKAIVSNMTFQDNMLRIIYLDGHNNPGFSGGPVVFQFPPNSQNYRVAGVISGYRYTDEPIFDGNEPLPLAYKYNTGIIISYSINHAIKVIKDNPKGFLLPE